jgi:hypothetical protein
MRRIVLLCLGVSLVVTGALNAQSREQKVRNDRRKVEAEGFWIYNDFSKLTRSPAQWRLASS